MASCAVPRRIIVGITGATGVQMGIRLLEALRAYPEVESHAIVSEGARVVLEHEYNATLDQVLALADVAYDNANLAAAISSGSYRTDGMVIIPCSMKTLSAVANAYDDDLIVRAADVCRKEGRPVVLVPREMPLNHAHCRNLLQACEDGYVICPPMLTFYNGCQTTMDQVDHVVGKVLMQFGLDYDQFHPWEGVHEGV